MVGHKIKIAREVMGVTQRGASLACGWGPRRWERFEYGQGRVLASDLAILANVLRKPLQYFIPTEADTILGECLADTLFNEMMLFWVRMTPKQRHGVRTMVEGVVDG
jgi:transcriptional regulator with XRE-family HTH domain